MVARQISIFQKMENLLSVPIYSFGDAILEPPLPRGNPEPSLKLNTKIGNILVSQRICDTVNRRISL